MPHPPCGRSAPNQPWKTAPFPPVPHLLRTLLQQEQAQCVKGLGVLHHLHFTFWCSTMDRWYFTTGGDRFYQLEFHLFENSLNAHFEPESNPQHIHAVPITNQCSLSLLIIDLKPASHSQKSSKKYFNNILNRNLYIVILEVPYQCSNPYARYLVTICLASWVKGGKKPKSKALFNIFLSCSKDIWIHLCTHTPGQIRPKHKVATHIKLTWKT